MKIEKQHTKECPYASEKEKDRKKWREESFEGKQECFVVDVQRVSPSTWQRYV